MMTSSSTYRMPRCTKQQMFWPTNGSAFLCLRLTLGTHSTPVVPAAFVNFHVLFLLIMVSDDVVRESIWLMFPTTYQQHPPTDATSNHLQVLHQPQHPSRPLEGTHGCVACNDSVGGIVDLIHGDGLLVAPSRQDGRPHICTTAAIRICNVRVFR